MKEKDDLKPLEDYFPKLDKKGRPVIDLKTLDKALAKLAKPKDISPHTWGWTDKQPKKPTSRLRG